MVDLANMPLCKLQALYDSYAAKAGSRSTGVTVMKAELSLEERGPQIRQLLHDRGIVLHSQDKRYLRQSASLQSYWNGLSTQDRETRSQQIIAGQAKVSEEAWGARGAKISTGRKASWDSMTEQERSDHAAKISASMANMSEDAKTQRSKRLSSAVTNWVSQTGGAIANLTDEQKAQRNAKISARATKRWDSYTAEQRKDMGAKIAAGQLASDRCGLQYTVAGKQVCFHSSWEYTMYNLLLKLVGPQFVFANEHGTALDLTTKVWCPDFIVFDSDIIEVKGYGPAKVKFDQKDLPAFLASQFAEQYNLWLCEFDVARFNFESYEDLLAACTEVHRVS